MLTRTRKITPRREESLKEPVRGHVFDTLRDVPDIRDRIYQPALIPLSPAIVPPADLHILDQGEDGACTGFALAATINFLLRANPARSREPRRVSPHMLYQMAKRFDEWRGSEYDGSSIRGALRGFYNMGVAAEALWTDPKQTELPVPVAKDARQTSLGAYYRLRPTLADYHTALNETGVICASASVHNGWDDPPDGRIEPRAGTELHAFTIVGYDAEGFWVQNSWGRKWGLGGIAHWQYQDWAANIEDAWVLQLDVSAPRAFGLGVKHDGSRLPTDFAGSKRAPPRRDEIAGHFVHVQNGQFSPTTPYDSDRVDVAGTAHILGTSTNYAGLVFYAHGGLNSPDEAATRTAAMISPFMDNRLYPYSVLYDTGLLQTLKDIITARGAATVQKTGGGLDLLDHLVEQVVGGIGTKLWKEMKADAATPFIPGHDGTLALALFAEALKGRDMPIHLIGHSTGAVLIGHLLDALDGIVPEGMTIASCSLMAPACTIDFYQKHYRPRLGGDATAKVKIDKLTLYCLTDKAEQHDQVTPFYNKSLLYLVSNAFEAWKPMPLLGMQTFHADANLYADPVKIWYACTDGAPTESTSHGGFDNDLATMNDILRTILGKAPDRPFTPRDLDY